MYICIHIKDPMMLRPVAGVAEPVRVWLLMETG